MLWLIRYGGKFPVSPTHSRIKTHVQVKRKALQQTFISYWGGGEVVVSQFKENMKIYVHNNELQLI